MKHILATSCATISLISFMTPANAQDIAETISANDIVVTARRVSERLQDVPIAVTALQGNKLAELGIQQVIDLRQAVPGLNISAATGRISTPIFTIRGQRTSDVAMTIDSPVTIYMDEAILTPLVGSNLGIFDLENVQVLKGPQGTLFGRNTTGGAILYTTAKPTDRLEGQVTLGYGNYDAKTGTAVLNLPVSEAIRLRGAFNFTKTDGYGRVIAAPGANPGPQVGKRLAARDELNFRLTAAIDLSDVVRTTTTGYYSRTHNTPAPFTLFGQPNPTGLAARVFGQPYLAAAARSLGRSVYVTESSRDKLLNQTKIYGFINTVSVELGDDLTLKNIVSFRDTMDRDSTDYDGTIFPLHDSGGIQKMRTWTEELQLQGSGLDGRLEYVFGGFFLTQNGKDGRGFGDVQGTVLVGGVATQYADLRHRSFSGFGQGTFKLTDSLNLTAGLRYTVDRKAADIVSGNFPLTACNFRNSAGVPFPANQCIIRNDKTFSSPSWLVSIDKKLGDGTLIYLASRHSYRAGGFTQRATTTESAQQPFAPEKVTDLELGIKRSQNLGRGFILTANVAGSYQWYKNIQRGVTTSFNTASGPVLANIIRNAAKAHILGGELEATLQYEGLLQIGVNYAYTAPKYDSFPTLATVNGVLNQPDDYSDRHFSHIAKHQINANITLSPDIGNFAKLRLTGTVYYQSRIFFSEDIQNRAQVVRSAPASQVNTLPQKIVVGQNSYALTNFRAELTKISGTGLSAALWVRNALDKRYRDSGGIFINSFGASYGVYGAPRTYGAEMTYKF